MALGYLGILFIIILLVSGAGIAFLFLSKNAKIKNVLFYFLTIWGIWIAYLSSSSRASNYIGEKAVVWLIGALSVLAIIVKVKKSEKQMISYVLVTLSVVLGMLGLFFI
ncbi:MAG: hypothetical protein RSD28_05560 [Lachnospiraceae bacterium]